MGYFLSIPIELERAAMVDGAAAWACSSASSCRDLPGARGEAFFSFTLAWNEYLYASVFVSD